MIASTDIHNFVEKGEDCTSTISVGKLEKMIHTIGYDMNLFGCDMILIGSNLIFFFQDLSLKRFQ